MKCLTARHADIMLQQKCFFQQGNIMFNVQKNGFHFCMFYCSASFFSEKNRENFVGGIQCIKTEGKVLGKVAKIYLNGEKRKDAPGRAR